MEPDFLGGCVSAFLKGRLSSCHWMQFLVVAIATSGGTFVAVACSHYANDCQRKVATAYAVRTPRGKGVIMM